MARAEEVIPMIRNYAQNSNFAAAAEPDVMSAIDFGSLDDPLRSGFDAFAHLHF
jgi:hypothetical protein